MVHHYAFAMKVAAKQETERPSLRHRLQGENSLNGAKPRRAAQQSREESIYRAKPRRKTQAEAQTSQLHTTQAESRIPQSRYETTRVDADSGTRVEADFGYHPKPTQLELEGAC